MFQRSFLQMDPKLNVGPFKVRSLPTTQIPINGPVSPQTLSKPLVGLEPSPPKTARWLKYTPCSHRGFASWHDPELGLVLLPCIQLTLLPVKTSHLHPDKSTPFFYPEVLTFRIQAPFISLLGDYHLSPLRHPAHATSSPPQVPPRRAPGQDPCSRCHRVPIMNIARVGQEERSILVVWKAAWARWRMLEMKPRSFSFRLFCEPLPEPA